MDPHLPPFSPNLQQEEHCQQPPLLLPPIAGTSITGTSVTGTPICVDSAEPTNSHSVSPPSPRGTFTNNTSLKSELDKIQLRDHCLDNQTETEGIFDPENINMASLLSKIRQIRSSGQIQYRIPKKRKKEGPTPLKAEDGDTMEMDKVELSDDHEVVTIYRQKRVKKTPKARTTPYNKEKRHQKSHREGQSSRSQHKPPSISTETPSLPETVCDAPPIPGDSSEPR